LRRQWAPGTPHFEGVFIIKFNISSDSLCNKSFNELVVVAFICRVMSNGLIEVPPIILLRLWGVSATNPEPFGLPASSSNRLRSSPATMVKEKKRKREKEKKRKREKEKKRKSQ
jgi:hypothetical protein